MRVLVLGAHCDDEAFGCGGAIRKHVEAGDKVHAIAFSNCGREDLLQEATRASIALGSTVEVKSFPVRRFNEFRQDILDLMIAVRQREPVDIVYVHASTDKHQDHEVIHQEGFRAFKHCTVLGYELPWNCRSFTIGSFVKLNEEHVIAKVRAVSEYRSQAHRPYFSEEVIRSQCIARGVQAGCRYAEAFEVIRWIS